MTQVRDACLRRTCRPPEQAQGKPSTLVNRHHDRSRSVDVRRPRSVPQGPLRVTDAGYTNPTPIQAGAIPPPSLARTCWYRSDRTGKTAAFVLPMITRLEKGRARARMPRTLILEPTRELAAQVEENFTATARTTS